MRLLLIWAIFLIPINLMAAGVKSLPSDLKWETTEIQDFLGSPDAKVGGTVNDFLPSFPLTMRQVGPDSNGAFRSYLDANDMSLISLHPNTEEFIPELASHWAFDKNKRTVYYKLRKEARWSDGKPVTADDFVFALEFNRSKHIVAPWYNQYFTKEIEAVQKFVDSQNQEVVAVTLPVPKPNLLYYTNIGPQPKHFFKLDKDFVTRYNWKVKPNTGPYYVSKIKKGKSIVFKRKKDWWARSIKWYQHRYNINKVIFKVIRDYNVAFEYLKKGKIDKMTFNFPDYWHDKSKIREFEHGYIHKLMFYNDKPRSDYVMTLNENYGLFKDPLIREAFHYAMNVDKVIDQVLRGDYERLQGISRGYGKYTNLKIKARKFDLKKAQDLFAQAGWTKRNNKGLLTKDGKVLSATVIYSQAQMAKRLVVLREEAKKAGIDLKLKQMDGSARWKSFLEKKHEIAYMSWSTRFKPQYHGQYHSSYAGKPQNNNLSNTADPELDKDIESYRSSINEDERIKLAHKIQQRVHDRAIQIPLFEVPYFREAHWAWVKYPEIPATRNSSGLGYFSTSDGGLIWIDLDEKKAIEKARKKRKKLEPKTIVNEKYRVKAG